MNDASDFFMPRVRVLGTGCVGSFGAGCRAFEDSLWGARPEPGVIEFRDGAEVRAIRAHIADTAPLESYFPKRRLRRLDRFSRLALLGACLALEDSGILRSTPQGSALDFEPGALGLVVATGYGASATTFAFLDSVLDDGDALASPTHFSHSVHNSAAANVAMLLSLTGPSLTVSQFELSFASALGTALAWIRQGRVRAVLLGGVDEVCHVLGYCHSRCPGRADDAGVGVPGEGAAFLVLEKANAEGGAIPELRNVFFESGAPWRAFDRTGASAWITGGGTASQRLPDDGGPILTFDDLGYGVIPSGQGLDVVAAMLALKRRELPLSGKGCRAGLYPTEMSNILCLKAGRRHGDGGARKRLWAGIEIGFSQTP